MLNSILSGLNFIWKTYIISYEGIATFLIVLVMLLKVLINQKASALNFKKMFISLPSELVFLVLGFIFADMIGANKSATDNDAINQDGNIASIVIALIILVALYALEKWINDKLSGEIKKRILAIIVLMYLTSVVFYLCVIFGGI